MKKKKLLLILFLVIFILFGCQKNEPRPIRRYFMLEIVGLDNTFLKQEQGVYVLEEHQTYVLMLSPYGPFYIIPESYGLEYDETIFEIVCTTTPENPDYGCDVYYDLTCLKKCESTAFVVYILGERENPKYCYELVFRVE